MQKELKIELGFVQRRLPWVIAAVAFVVYLVTLNHSATYAGLVNLARVVGWDWRPNIGSPLQVLVTFPVRWFPAGLQLTALNVIAAGCAAAGLGLLARCVALLPQDRTRDQRQYERSEHSLLSNRWAWVPPVLAAGVAGFQVSFWENAVVGTGEALDLLVFAWLVHALLMFRLDQRESRLGTFALVYGLGMANNHALIAFLPFFLGALIWIQGLAFFRWRRLVRMTLLGLAGLLLYLLPPILGVLGPDSGYTFWDMLKTAWATQRDSLVSFPRIVVVLASLTSVLPVIFMGIRWPAQFGEVSPLGNALTNLMTHLIHLVFLIACTYVAFDQYFSPRNLSGGSAAFLPLYFLGALSIGYCAGYFLAVCGSAIPNLPQWQRPSALRLLLNKSAVVLILLGTVAVPGALVWQNLPQIWANTGASLSRATSLAAKSLPADGAVVLSDEPFRLYAMEDELRRAGTREKYLLVDTRSLESGAYHLRLMERHAQHWPKPATRLDPKDRIAQSDLAQMMKVLASRLPVFYLHPSFGYYFEYFEARPRGLIYQLMPLPAGSAGGAPLSQQEMADADQFWRQVKADELDALIPRIPPAEFPAPGVKMNVRPMTLEMYVGRGYSQCLNTLGVMFQRAGQLPRAAEYYGLALKLDPMNPAAMLNAEFNTQLQAGKRDALKLSDGVLKRIGMAGGSWDAILGSHGSVEEPGVCLQLARAFDAGNNPRQAAQTLERVIAYTPDDLQAQTILVGLYVRAMLPDLALQRLAIIRGSAGAARLTPLQLQQLAVAEAWAHVSRKDVARAEQILRAEIARQPGEDAAWSALFDIQAGAGKLAEAMAVVEEQLKGQPRNVQALVNAGVLKNRLGQPAEAVPFFNRALAINPKDEYALLNRAIVQLASGNLDGAEKDFEALSLSKGRASTQVTLGLADIYYRKKRNRDAVRLYRQLSKTLPKDSAEYRMVTDRLKQLD